MSESDAGKQEILKEVDSFDKHKLKKADTIEKITLPGSDGKFDEAISFAHYWI